MINVKGKNNKRILCFFILVSCILIDLVNFHNSIYLFISVIVAILLLILNLVYINKEYKKICTYAKSNKKRYNMVLELLDGAIWEWNSFDEKLFLSRSIKEFLNTTEEIKNFESLISFISEDEREDIRIFIENTINRRVLDEFVLEYTIINSNGEKVILKTNGKGTIINNIFYLSGRVMNITNEKILKSINSDFNKNILSLYESRYIAFSWNVKENIVSISSGIRKYLNIEGDGDLLISYFTWLKYISKKDIVVYKNKINKLINSNKKEYYTTEYRIVSENNKEYWFESKGKKTIEKNGDIFVHGTLTDITERKEKEIEICYLTFNDEVTKMPNRRYFMREVSSYIKNKISDSIAFIFIDLDNFKYVNDTYGHDVGDILLCKFSNIILSMNIEKSFFARYGGDEFVLTVYDFKNKREIKQILDEIIKRLSDPLIVNGKEIFCTLSIGVSIYPTDGEELGILLKRADMAMYLAKTNGKNRYEFFDLKLLEILDREFNIEKGLRVAIDNNEIKLVYQPKLMINTEEVIGFESLIRWNSKELGVVSPGEFIPIAESSGLILSIGKYIIEESFKKCKEISLKSDKRFKMAINLSEVQIRDEEIVDFIYNLLKKYDLEANYIEFEITESIIMKSPEKNINTLEKLKELGVTLALDDFGTGYSSLSYLRNLPIDVLKIDKSFIDGILIEEKSEYIINSIIELSHYLNLIVVAEGVETKEQLEYLKKINCDIMQGYYFSKPIEFEKVLQMI